MADIKGDSYFDLKFSKASWKLEHEEYATRSVDDEFDTCFKIYQRRKRYKRYKYVSNFFTDKESKASFIDKYIADNINKFTNYETNHAIEVQESFLFGHENDGS